MEDFPSKLSGGDLHTYDFGGQAQHFGSGTTGVQALDNIGPFVGQQPSQLEANLGIIATPGTSLQEDFRGEATGSAGTGRKKKKKQKSGDLMPDTGKPDLMEEDELVDAAIPLLPENQSVEDLLFPTSLPVPPPAGGTLVGGQYLLNNALLDQILAEKKMQLMQSPEVMEFLKKQMAKK